MLVADIAEARWRGLMRQLTEARGETSTALAERAGLDRPRWSYVTVGDRLPADVTERRALLARVLDALEAPPSVRLELGLLAGVAAPAGAYVVELEPGVWLAPWSGDPGRTCVEADAVRFASVSEATEALRAAERHRRLPRAMVRPVAALEGAP